MQTLCINCDNNQSCQWKNDHVILCNEHATSTVTSTVTVTPAKKFNGNQVNLCGTCINYNSCVFIQQGLKTIFCEEYQ